ncbi:MAG: c-type cytochrome domain-containing protein [Planctomycetaceae bacterium]
MIVVVLALAVTPALFFAPAQAEGDAAPEPEKLVYDRDIKSFLDAACARCHAGKTRHGGLDMSTPALMLKGGVSGPAYVAGNSKKSLMIELIEFKEMPPKDEKPPLTKEELEKLREWIDAGAAE